MGQRGFSADEAYHAVTGVFHALGEKAVLFEPDDLGESFWIPLSTVRGVDVKALETTDRGETTTIHVMEWILKKHGVL